MFLSSSISIFLLVLTTVKSLAFTYEAALLSFVLPTAILFSINADIGPSAQINWAATAWSLSSAVIQTVTGRCSDIFGRRNFTLAGNLFGLTGMYNAVHISSEQLTDETKDALLLAGMV